MEASSDLIIFWAIVLLRVSIPLAIPRYPLPGIIAAFVLDAIDQSLFQALTSLQLDGYQRYDKALDVYYLAIAYIATMRNWTNHFGLQIGRFLFYYRLVGVALFEVFQARWLLLLFPNVFEYFFIFYEIVCLRWDARRLSNRILLLVTALIWIVIKLPQEYWIHVAQLDVTDTIKQSLLGYPLSASWGTILAARPLLVPLFLLALAVFAITGWRLIRPSLPPNDWTLSVTPDAHLPSIERKRLQAAERALAGRFLDIELLEKIVLIALLVIIFAHILPGMRASDLELAAAILIIITVNTLVSETLVRHGHSSTHALRHGLVMIAVNLPLFLAISLVRFGSLPLPALTNIIVFTLLLSLIIILYDRYRPVYLVRFMPDY